MAIRLSSFNPTTPVDDDWELEFDREDLEEVYRLLRMDREGREKLEWHIRAERTITYTEFNCQVGGFFLREIGDFKGKTYGISVGSHVVDTDGRPLPHITLREMKRRMSAYGEWLDGD